MKWTLAAVDVDPLQFHCSVDVVIPGGVVGNVMTAGTVLDSGSGMTRTSKRFGAADGTSLPRRAAGLPTCDGAVCNVGEWTRLR